MVSKRLVPVAVEDYTGGGAGTVVDGVLDGGVGAGEDGGYGGRVHPYGLDGVEEC